MADLTLFPKPVHFGVWASNTTQVTIPCPAGMDPTGWAVTFTVTKGGTPVITKTTGGGITVVDWTGTVAGVTVTVKAFQFTLTPTDLAPLLVVGATVVEYPFYLRRTDPGQEDMNSDGTVVIQSMR